MYYVPTTVLNVKKINKNPNIIQTSKNYLKISHTCTSS